MILFVQEHIYFSFCHNGKIYQFFVSSWAQYRKASSRRKRIEEEKQSPKGADVCRTPLLLYMVASINCLGSQRAAFIKPYVVLVCFYLCNIKPSCLSLLKKALIINTVLLIHLLKQILLFFQNSATIDCMNSLQQTPLAVAAAYNHVPIIEYLLKQGAEIETKDKDGYTPLLMVCCFCWNGVLFIFHIKNPPNYFSFLVGSLWG